MPPFDLPALVKAHVHALGQLYARGEYIAREAEEVRRGNVPGAPPPSDEPPTYPQILPGGHIVPPLILDGVGPILISRLLLRGKKGTFPNG